MCECNCFIFTCQSLCIQTFLLLTSIISFPIRSCPGRSPGGEDTTATSSNHANIIDGSSMYLSPHPGTHSYHHSQGRYNRPVFHVFLASLGQVSHIPNVHPIEMAERENKGGDYQQSLAPWGRL